MSELKTRYIDDTYVEYYNTGKHELAQIYLKSEADNVISQLKEGAKNLILDNYLKDREIKHHKYKRCLGIAGWCRARYNLWPVCFSTAPTRKMKFFDKWEKRWMELAKKFKEAK
jgi:hypothetical protein